MIELNEKTQQDFLNREWVQKLLDVGVDMSDAKYALYRLKDVASDIVVYQGTYFADDRYYNGIKVENMVPIVPTYTVSELLYKLRNRYGMYTIFNCYRNLDADNVPIIESLASILLQSCKSCKKDTNNG